MSKVNTEEYRLVKFFIAENAENIIYDLNPLR